MAVALCFAVLCLCLVACYALWAMWGVVKALRTALYETGRQLSEVQARWLAHGMDMRGSPATIVALEQAAPRPLPPLPPQEFFDDPGSMAG